MAVHFASSAPKQLLASFDARIAQKESKGKITTWEKHGDFYTHTSTQWRGEAWVRPTVFQGRLTFNIYPSENKSVTVVAYGFYHGHLIETFLNHFDTMFTTGAATAQPEAPDKMA